MYDWKFLNIVKTLLSKKWMLIRFVNFFFYIFFITSLSAEKNDSKIQTEISWLKFSPSPNIHKRFKCMRSISTGGSSYWRCSVKTGFLKISEIHRKTVEFSFNKISRLGLGQMFSCKFCKIFKNSFYTRHLRETVSGLAHLMQKLLGQIKELQHWSTL